MRPTSQQQGAFRAPLNAILGRESKVRVLRVLSVLNHPLSPAEVARQAALQPSGVRRVLNELADTGIVEFVGMGARQFVQLRDEYPLIEVVRALFQGESDRVSAVYEGISMIVQRLAPPSRAVWIEGPVATNKDQLNDPLTLGVLANSQDIGVIVEHLQKELAEVERAQDITIDIRPWTIPDLQVIQEDDKMRLLEAHPIFGPPPATFLDSRDAQGRKKRRNVIAHSDLDARARALGIAIGDKLVQDPSIIPRTKARLVALLEEAAPYEQHELREWLRILESTSLPRLRHLLADPGERGIRLRQSLPFLDVLTPEERDKTIEGVIP